MSCIYSMWKFYIPVLPDDIINTNDVLVLP